MAQGKDNEKLKADAIASLAASRSEISDGWHRLKEEVSPRHVMHAMWDRHMAVVLGSAVAVGLGGVLLVGRRSHAPKAAAMSERTSSPPPKKARLGMLSILVQAMIPILIKSTITPGLIQSIMAKRRRTSDHPE